VARKIKQKQETEGDQTRTGAEREAGQEPAEVINNRPYISEQAQSKSIRQPDRPVLPMLTCVLFRDSGISCGHIPRLRSTCRIRPREYAGSRSRTPDRCLDSMRRGQRIDLHGQGVGSKTSTAGTRVVPQTAASRRYSARVAARSVRTVDAASRDVGRSTARPEHRLPFCV
jgi:hypothetical protein